MNDIQFWQREGIHHIVPQGFGDFPEGFDIRSLLKEIVDSLSYSSIIDFGCGSGRLCESFDPTRYLGLDINPLAIQKAREQFKNYQFLEIDASPLVGDIVLAYMVFLHIRDKELDQALKSIRCKWLIVGEVLGREWRGDSIPPTYSRDLSEYISEMRKHDFVLHQHLERPYDRYRDSLWYQGRNTNLSLLIFRKCFKNPLAN